MPEISRFFGIVIRMYYFPKEHPPAHLHAVYGEREALIEIETLEVLRGRLPDRALRMVAEWMRLHREGCITVSLGKPFRQGLLGEGDLETPEMRRCRFGPESARRGLLPPERSLSFSQESNRQSAQEAKKTDSDGISQLLLGVLGGFAVITEESSLNRPVLFPDLPHLRIPFSENARRFGVTPHREELVENWRRCQAQEPLLPVVPLE